MSSGRDEQTPGVTGEPGTSAAAAERHRRPRGSRRTPVLLLAGAIAWLALVAAVPPDIRWHTEGRLTQVWQLKPVAATAIWYLGGAALVSAIAGVTLSISRRRYGCGLLCFAMIVPVLPYAALYRFFAGIAPWIPCSTEVGPDGQTYTFLYSSFMQGQTIALGRGERTGLLYTAYDILGDTNGDSPRSYALIVRPAERVRNFYGMLEQTDDGLLLGLRYDNHCYFAYDVNADRFTGREGIEGLSPFVLIGPESKLYDGDVESLIEGRPSFEWQADVRPRLEEARQNANAQVRDVAAQALAALDRQSP